MNKIYLFYLLQICCGHCQHLFSFFLCDTAGVGILQQVVYSCGALGGMVESQSIKGKNLGFTYMFK